MKESNLKDYCEHLFIKRRSYAKDANWSRYSSYMCELTNEGCIGAEMKLWKIWKMRDDLDSDAVEKCHLRELRKELTSKVS